MKLYEVIVRDSYNGKQYIYFVNASSASSTPVEARMAHKKNWKSMLYN